MSNLTISMQHYIQSIYDLSHDGEGIRVSDVAKKRKVSKSSACIAIKALQQDGLIWRDTDRLVFLTDFGKKQALIIANKFAIIQQFLVDVLGISRETAAMDAWTMEHSISMETLCSICRFSNVSTPKRHCKGECHVGLCEDNP